MKNNILLEQDLINLKKEIEKWPLIPTTGTLIAQLVDENDENSDVAISENGYVKYIIPQDLYWELCNEKP